MRTFSIAPLLVVSLALTLGAAAGGCDRYERAKSDMRTGAKSAAVNGINSVLAGTQDSRPAPVGNTCKSILADDIQGACTATLDMNEDTYVWTITKPAMFEIRARQKVDSDPALAPEITVKSGQVPFEAIGHSAPSDHESSAVFKLDAGSYELDVRETKSGTAEYELTVIPLGSDSACGKLVKKRADCDRMMGDAKKKDACRAVADGATRTGDEYKCRDALAGWDKMVSGK